MAFKMTGVLKCSLRSFLLPSIGSPRKRTVESTSEFKHFILFQIWHKPTARLWKMQLTDTNSFRLWKDEKVRTRQCLLHYLLPCITSIIGNAAVVSEEWKTRIQCFKKEQKNRTILVSQYIALEFRIMGYICACWYCRDEIRPHEARMRMRALQPGARKGEWGQNFKCVQATTDTNILQANNSLWIFKVA